MQINIVDDLVDVIIIKKRSNKNTYMRVKEDLKLYVTTSIFVSDRKIKEIINENIDSITKMYTIQKNKSDLKEQFYYLGKKYDLVTTNTKNIEIINDKIFVPKDYDVDKWLMSKAKILFQERLDYWYNNFNRKIPYPRLTIRKMNTRWGVCNSKLVRVTLNFELIKKDITCLDYVIVHELSHFISMDHSKKFWSVVEENYPNYKEIKKIMKNY